MATRPLVQRARHRAHAVQASVREAHARWLERRRFRAAGRAIAAHRGEAQHLAAFEAECARSHEADSADSAAVDRWMLPMVALRGLMTRAVLRHRIVRGHRLLGERYEALGRAVVTGAGLTAPAAAPEAELKPLAPITTKAGAEAARFGRAFWAEIKPAMLPKAPALAGLAAGWWIAHTYTDSRWKSLARSIGIGSGGTTVVSSETYRAMRFWLPLVAAAACAYLGDRIAAALRDRVTAPPYRGRSNPAEEPESP